MTELRQDAVDQAITWHLRLPSATDQDWLRFTEWLERDRAHAEAYDRIVDDEIMAAPVLDLQAEARGSIRRVEQRQSAWRRRGGWMLAGGGALAASLAATVLLPLDQAAVAASYTTAPGERRELVLEDGSRVEMNGATEIVVDSSRRVSLNRGQAVFHVRHDPRAPFEVATGGVVLRDVGTVFDVSREGGRLGVKVAEGAVLYQPDREGLTLHQGMALAARDGEDRIVVRKVPAESVGGWRHGRLAFRETPLGEVAAEIRRTTGHPLFVERRSADLPFTGSIRIGGDPARDAAHVAELAGLAARPARSGWILTSVRDAAD